MDNTQNMVARIMSQLDQHMPDADEAIRLDIPSVAKGMMLVKTILAATCRELANSEKVQGISGQKAMLRFADCIDELPVIETGETLQ